MKMIIVISTIGMLLLTSVTTLSAYEEITATLNEIVVPDDYQTIQDAINHAQDYDTIRVRPGTYHEHLTINVIALNLIGESPSNTIIDGSGSGTVVLINSYVVDIHGFKIQNGENGISFGDRSIGCVIHENIISSNEIGVNSGISHSSQIYHNTFVDNTDNAHCESDITIWYNNEINEGNYWDDYTGVDADGDGIGDTPYIINPGGVSNSNDKYPLMTPLQLNNAPNKPTCKYSKNNDEIVISTIDTDGDIVRFGISWNNENTVDEWTEQVESGTEVRVDCNGRSGTVGVIAEDEHGARSAWISEDTNARFLSHPILLRFITILECRFQALFNLLLNF